VDAQTEIANGREAPAKARRFVRSLADRLPPSVIEDASLVVSELVTNSYKHAGKPEGFPIKVTLDLTEDRVRVEVVDGSIFDPQPESTEELRDTKWGLTIVDRIATDWGRISEGGVWAEIRAGLTEHSDPDELPPIANN
jgi:anti-sigma regulatory factor (Ser/Thr protein kinase)